MSIVVGDGDDVVVILLFNNNPIVGVAGLSAKQPQTDPSSTSLAYSRLGQQWISRFPEQCDRRLITICRSRAARAWRGSIAVSEYNSRWRGQTSYSPSH